jgi:hemerythrin-like metal-binding protein
MNISIAQWKPEYATGNPLVDEQHQSIFCIINALRYALAEGQEDTLIEQTLQGVKDYTLIHCDHEEQFMLECHYPGYEQHRQKHEALKAAFAVFTAQHFPDLNQRTVMLANFLTAWLIEHIRDEDQKLVSYSAQETEDAIAGQVPEQPVGAFTAAPWRPEYETGFSLIDDQHRSLFHAINALQSSIMAGRGAELVGRTLTLLDHYTTIHFATEEKFMVRFNYPDYAKHVERHKELRSRFERFIAQKDDYDQSQQAIQLSRLLTNWLIHHIKDEDLKMISFLKVARQKQPLPPGLVELRNGNEPVYRHSS